MNSPPSHGATGIGSGVDASGSKAIIGPLKGVDPFNPDLSVTDIFGKLSGSLLLDAIFATYQVGEKSRIKFFIDNNSCDNVAFPFVNRSPNIVRHEFNQRKHEGIKQSYIRSCQSRGIVEGVRGEAWVGEPLPDKFGQKSGAFQALTYGSLTESFYAALSLDPQNDLLLRTLARGLEVRVFSNRMPESVTKYVVKLHNRFHNGAGISFIELMQSVEDVTWCLFKSVYVVACDCV